LRDYHPYAKVKSQTRDFFVVNFDEDKLKKARLDQKILDMFNQRLFCSKCNLIFPSETLRRCSICNTNLLNLYNVVPKSVDILFHRIPINFEDSDNKKIFTDDLFPLTNQRNPKINVRKTYCFDSNFIYYFKPIKTVNLKNIQSNESLIELSLGELGICYYSEKFQVSYSNGIFDRKDRYFIICGEEGCNSILDHKNNYECPKNKNHSEKKYIRLLRDFHSKGIHIVVNNAENNYLAHTLSHGLKLALQKIAGVDIRTIGESEGTDLNPFIYIFDTVIGGNGICETLFYLIEGEYKNLREALKIMKRNFSSCCKTSCPHCLYQYGCYKHNDPISFDKRELLNILNEPYIIEIDDTTNEDKSNKFNKQI